MQFSTLIRMPIENIILLYSIFKWWFSEFGLDKIFIVFLLSSAVWKLIELCFYYLIVNHNNEVWVFFKINLYLQSAAFLLFLLNLLQKYQRFYNDIDSCLDRISQIMIAFFVYICWNRRSYFFRHCVEEQTLPVWHSPILGPQKLQSWYFHRLTGGRLLVHLYVILLSQFMELWFCSCLDGHPLRDICEPHHSCIV